MTTAHHSGWSRLDLTEFRLSEKLPKRLKGSLPTIEELEAELSAGPGVDDQEKGSSSGSGT